MFGSHKLDKAQAKTQIESYFRKPTRRQIFGENRHKNYYLI